MSAQGQPMVRIAEDDRAGLVIDLDAATAAGLQRSGLVQVTVAGPGRWLLTPCGRVGAIRTEDLSVMVTPKVGIARLLFLLGYAADPRFRPDEVPGLDEPDLLPALAETLCRHIERAVGRGVLQGYRTHDDALTVVRGRLRLSDQFARRPGTLLPLEVTYDDYSPDITENRILRSAIRRMLAVPRLAPRASGRLRHLDGLLRSVHVLPDGAPLPNWHKTRLNLRYHPALRISELVLRNHSLEVNNGPYLAAGFVVDMAKVFEDFVTTAITEALTTYPGQTHSQFTDSLDTTGQVKIRPDIVHIVAGKPRIVIDAKYKSEKENGGFPNSDYYQMLAYCTTLALPTGWLIYAQGAANTATRRIRNAGISIITHPLDLTAHPAELLEQTRAITKLAWENLKFS